jgi:2'-5' RNA ligase
LRQNRGDPYAGIPGRRLFVGVPLPDDAAATVAAIVEGVRAQPLPAGARDVRWVRLDGLHLTLRFLGPTPEERIADTEAAVLSVAHAIDAPIELELAGAGTFPPVGRPRTIWIGVAGDTEALERLGRRTEEALVAAGWPPDARPFRPHLTLARSDGVAVGPLVAGRLASATAETRIRCSIDRIGLFESVTGGGPARYVPVVLERFAATPPDATRVYHQSSPDPH